MVWKWVCTECCSQNASEFCALLPDATLFHCNAYVRPATRASARHIFVRKEVFWVKFLTHVKVNIHTVVGLQTVTFRINVIFRSP